MRSILGCMALGICLLMVTGCDHPAVGHDYTKAGDRVLNKDPNLIASDWYCEGYESYEPAWKNTVFLKMLGLHGILWLGISIFIHNRHPWKLDSRLDAEPSDSIFTHIASRIVGKGTNDDELVGVTAFFGGNVILFVVWVVLWLVSGLILAVFSPGAYLPFDFVGFLTLVGLYAAVAAVFAARIINMIIGRPTNLSDISKEIATQSPSPSVTISRTTAPSRRARIVRAMLKTLFVAIASSIGGRIGGWIGGVLVFVISAGVSAYFEIPQSDSDPSHHHEPPSSHSHP